MLFIERHQFLIINFKNINFIDIVCTKFQAIEGSGILVIYV
jgi:hypothetical protein